MTGALLSQMGVRRKEKEFNCTREIFSCWVFSIFPPRITLLGHRVALRIFFSMFFKKHKLHNLIKRKIYILTKKKKKTQIHKVLQYKACGVQLWLLLVLLNRDGRRCLGRVSEFLISFKPLGLI